MFEIATATDPCANFQTNPVSVGSPQVAVDVVSSTVNDNPWIKWAALGVVALIIINLVKK